MRLLAIVTTGAALLLLAACGTKVKPSVKASSGDSPVTAMLKTNQVEGKVVLVEFGAIGCHLSEQGLNAMADLLHRNAIPGLAFVRLEPTGSAAIVNGYYATRSLGFPVVRDPDMTVANALGTTVFPRFVLLDKFGWVRYRGNMPAEKDLADWAGKLAAEKADAGPDAPLLGSVALDAPALFCGTRLPDLSGSVKSLADYRGKQGLLLTFVDTKCPFSQGASKEMPSVASGLAKVGVSTVLVNLGDPQSDVKRSYGAGFSDMSVVYDVGKQTQKNWGIEYVPTAMLLDTAGQVIYRGSPVWGDVASALSKRLNLSSDAIKLDAQGTKQG